MKKTFNYLLFFLVFACGSHKSNSDTNAQKAQEYEKKREKARKSENL